MPERRVQSVRSLGRASDTELVRGLAQHGEPALQELSQRPAAALSVLACAIVRQPVWARRAVSDVFTAIKAEPSRLDASGGSVRSQLAALVHERCCTLERERPRAASDSLHLAGSARRGAVENRERIAVALIAFGDHTCRQAAERVGSPPSVVAERLRAFVLDPDHFKAFRDGQSNVVALRDARLRR